MTRIITLLRHGQVAGPAALYGHTNVGLSEAGARELRDSLDNIHQHSPITQIISSPLDRCAAMAKFFAAQYELPLCLEPQLQEMHFGEWDGVPYEQLQENWDALESFWNNPKEVQAPKGESLKQFGERVIAAWEKLIASHNSGHQLVLCHGGVIRVLIAHILQWDWRKPSLYKQLNIDYASHTRIEIAAHDKALPVIRWIGLPG